MENKYSECVSVALFVLHTKSMTILPFVACLAVPDFSNLSYIGTVLGQKLLKVKGVFRFSLQFLSETLLILRRIHTCT